MKRAWPVTQAAISVAVWPLTIILSPVILVAGEAVNRYVMRRVRRSAVTVTGRLARWRCACQRQPRCSWW